MGEKAINGIVVVITAIVGVAIVAVIVSQKSGTADVLKAGGNAFASLLKSAVGPTNSQSVF